MQMNMSWAHSWGGRKSSAVNRSSIGVEIIISVQPLNMCYHIEIYVLQRAESIVHCFYVYAYAHMYIMHICRGMEEL